MNIVKTAILLVLVALVGYTGYTLVRERSVAAKEAANLAEIANKLSDENAKLESDIEYYKRPENLLKASKAQFNYKANGEQMIIVVPDTTSTTATSAKK